MQQDSQNNPSSRILKKFQRLSRRNKPLYSEAYKIMAASAEVIKIQFPGEVEFSPTAYFACLQEMLVSQLTAIRNGQPPRTNVDVLCYCYSAIISMLDFGVISDQETKISECVNFILTSGKCSATAIKYGIICLQFILHSKSEAQWNTDPRTEQVLAAILN